MVGTGISRVANLLTAYSQQICRHPNMDDGFSNNLYKKSRFRIGRETVHCWRPRSAEDLYPWQKSIIFPAGRFVSPGNNSTLRSFRPLQARRIVTPEIYHVTQTQVKKWFLGRPFGHFENPTQYNPPSQLRWHVKYATCKI